jgi:hypothetical protein
MNATDELTKQEKSYWRSSPEAGGLPKSPKNSILAKNGCASLWCQSCDPQIGLYPKMRLPHLLARVEQGCDLFSGWVKSGEVMTFVHIVREHRYDPEAVGNRLS